MKQLLGILLVAVFVVSTSRPVVGHVLITNQSGGQGAVLHVVPDDDPIAGQAAVLFLDIEDGPTDISNSQTKLIIKNEKDEKVEIPTEVDQSLIKASYTFPTQGVYELVYEINGPEGSSIFQQSQRVARGTVDSPLDRPGYGWAEVLLIASAAGLAILFIVAFNHRRGIAAQSKM